MQTKSINVQWWMSKTNLNGWTVDNGGGPENEQTNEWIVFVLIESNMNSLSQITHLHLSISVGDG